MKAVTENLKCCYLEVYLKYLFCAARDVTLIFFSPGNQSNLHFHSAIIFSIFWSATYIKSCCCFVLSGHHLYREISRSTIILPEGKITWEKGKPKRQRVKSPCDSDCVKKLTEKTNKNNHSYKWSWFFLFRVFHPPKGLVWNAVHELSRIWKRTLL